MNYRTLATREQILNVLKTGMDMIDHNSPPRAIREFMAMAVYFYGLDELLYAMEYLEQYRPLLKYL